MSKARGLADLGNVYNDGALSNRNLIINGAMQVAQRGTSFAGLTTPGYYGCDRFKANMTSGVAGTHTVTQAADGPAGFSSSHKIEVTTAEASPAAGRIIYLDHKLEGQNLSQLKKGTASAESVTLSFWVKSNKTGTYNLEFEDSTNSRDIIAAYTVDVSATWEYKTITFAGDVTGTFTSDNTQAARVLWWLAAGSTFSSGTRNTSWAATVNENRAVGNVNLADTIGNYFQITGVQLEVGDTATPFEHRSYGQELALCQRYFHLGSLKGLMGSYTTNNQIGGPWSFPVTMRAVPTVTFNTVGGSPNFSGVAIPNGVTEGAMRVLGAYIGLGDNEIGYIDGDYEADAEL